MIRNRNYIGADILYPKWISIHRGSRIRGIRALPRPSCPRRAGCQLECSCDLNFMPQQFVDFVADSKSATLVPFLSWTTTTLPLERSKHPRSVTPVEAFVAADWWLEGLFAQPNQDPSKSSNNGRRTPARSRFLSEVGTGAEQGIKGLGQPLFM